MEINRRSDPGRIKNETTDLQRDLAAKGGPAVGIGDAQNRQVPSPVDKDLSVQATISNRNNKNEDESSEEARAKNRSGKRVPGNNH